MMIPASEMHGIAEVQTTFHWEVTFTDVPGSSENVTKMCTSGDIPKGTHAGIDVTTHGYTFPSFGRIDRNGEITLTFFENVDQPIINMLETWQTKIWSNDTTADVFGKQQSSYADLMKAKITMDLQDKLDSPKSRYVLNHCVIGDLDPGGSLMDGSGPDYFKPVLNVRYGWYNREKL